MKLRTLIIVGAILSVAIGFTLGRTVSADAPAPGSSADPVVSKSYVDAELQKRIDTLEKSVAELSVQAVALQTMINELQTKLNKTPTTTTIPSGTGSTGGTSSGSTGSGSTSGGSTGTSGTSGTPGTSGTSGTTTGTGSTVVGKTAYIKAANTYVNLRSGPSTDTSVVKKVLKNEAMTILEVKESWYRVKLADNTTGWVANWVVDVK